MNGQQFGEVVRTHRNVWRRGRLVAEPLPRPQICLVSSDGRRAKQEGTDFASVIARLPDSRLAWWHQRMRCYHERELIRREMERRRLSTAAGDARGQMTLFPEDAADD